MPAGEKSIQYTKSQLLDISEEEIETFLEDGNQDAHSALHDLVNDLSWSDEAYKAVRDLLIKRVKFNKSKLYLLHDYNIQEQCEIMLYVAIDTLCVKI